ncbi:protein kinase [Clostridium sp.]|uniref:protein kinase domain-containing protein n=1 Tax=Clostridium sp. TaxID=1506 RepID=UPI00345541A4
MNSSYLLDLWKKEQRLNRIEQIINAIEYAHNDNKLHRDLSPQNILIFDNNGEIEVKVSDF